VQVQLAVTSDAFDAISRMMSNVDGCFRVLAANIELAGRSLPGKNSIGSFRLVEDLDTSEEKCYAVRNFRLFETRALALWRRRVLPLEPAPGQSYGASIAILLTEARYDISADRADIHSISCEGRVISQTGNPYNGADVSVEFKEYEPNQATDELPQRAFAGEFGYWPKPPGEDYSTTHFWLQLRYVPDDARGILLPMLAQDAGTELVLLVNFVDEKEDLLNATQELRGNVRSYSFRVRRRLFDDTTS
jgi:hypothetical protein